MESVRLDRYEIVDEIGQGAMGSVYLAQDTLIGRLVAIKTFNVKGIADTGKLSQLRALSVREASTAGILSHPNIVTIHDVVDTSGDSPPFIAMEYVKGTNLQELLKPQKPLPIDFVRTVVSQVASALDYAHSKQVVHRDVKPANILITEDEVVKLTDFGIAYLRGADPVNEKKRLGTPAYASPEQIMGDRVDHRADLFSLGVVLYEMLLGRAPFQGKTPNEVTHQIVHAPMPSPRSTDADFPEAIEKVLAKALNKAPGQRYQSAGKLAQGFRQAAASVPKEAPVELGLAPTFRKRKHLVETQALEAPAKGIARTSTERRLQFSKVLAQVLTALGQFAVLLARSTVHLARIAAPIARSAVVHFRSALRQEFSIRRVLLPSLVLSALLVTLGGVTLWWITSGIEEPAAPSSEYLLRLRYVPLLREGLRFMRAGEPVAAAELLAEAELIAPHLPGIPELRLRAEREAEELEAYARLDSEILALLAEGRAVLTAGRVHDAQVIAEKTQGLDSENLEVQQFTEEVENQAVDVTSRQPKRATRRAPRPKPEPAQPVTTLAEPAKPKPPPVRTGPANLRIDFFSHASKGVLTIYAQGEQILNRRFRFSKKTWLLLRKGTSGRLEDSALLQPGRTTLRIYVSIEGGETEMVRLPATFEPGSSHVLRIETTLDGTIKAYLR